MTKIILPCTINQRATGALMMTNFADPVDSAEKAWFHQNRIRTLIPDSSDFEPRLAMYLTDHSTPEQVVEGYKLKMWSAVKLYMANQQGLGGTTGSSHGVRDLRGRYAVFEAMEQHGIPLLGHFEAVEEDVDEFDREAVSLDRDLEPIANAFPGLTIVAEHITDSRMGDYVAGARQQIYATVTAHHPIINRNAMFWGGMNPGYYCKPVPKRERHRLAIRKYITSGNPRFGAGTDSAPHDEAAKSHCYGCAAGIFTALTAVELYTMIFDEDDALQYLGPFLSVNFLDVYGMKVSTEMMTIVRKTWIVPQKVGPVQVFRGGTELPWRLMA
jgi:dihydroorotase